MQPDSKQGTLDEHSLCRYNVSNEAIKSTYAIERSLSLFKEMKRSKRFYLIYVWLDLLAPLSAVAAQLRLPAAPECFA